MAKVLVSLLAVFAPLSLATIGGGQAILADVQRQVVEVHRWLTPAQFLNDFAISRMAPGPGSLLATLIGWQVAGVAGALVATVGIFGPTIILIYGVANLWSRQRGAPWQLALERGLRPVAAGMILAAVYVLFRSLEGGWLAWLIALVSTGMLTVSRVSPVLVLAGGAAAFVIVRHVLPS
jgi:chromate transporter